jgi:hypothetical protein
LNKEKQKKPNIFKSGEAIADFYEWCSEKDRKFYCFHGEHRRAAMAFLHSVSLFILYI